MSTLFERVKEHPVTTNVINTATLGWTFVQVHLWPVFSTGMILGAVAVLAACHEKQLIADSLFGGAQGAARRDSTAVAAAQQLFDEEAQQSVKRDVWAMPQADFRAEYVARHGPELHFR